MGYAHGTKWTEELIKEKVLEVVDALELKRMTSAHTASARRIGNEHT